MIIKPICKFLVAATATLLFTLAVPAAEIKRTGTGGGSGRQRAMKDNRAHQRSNPQRSVVHDPQSKRTAGSGAETKRVQGRSSGKTSEAGAPGSRTPVRTGTGMATAEASRKPAFFGKYIDDAGRFRGVEGRRSVPSGGSGGDPAQRRTAESRPESR